MRIRTASFATVLALVFAAHAPARAQSAPPDTGIVGLDRIVAVVGDQPITRYDLQERLLQREQQGVKPPTESEQRHAYELQVLNEMIDEELLLQRAKELKIEVADNELNSLVDKQIRDTKARFASETEFRTELAKAGLGTPEEYRRLLLDQLRRQQTIDRTMAKLREENKLIPVNVPDADVRDAFERNRALIPPRPPAVTFRQVVIAPKPTPAAREVARVKAESILAELNRGGDFELLAKRESMDPTTRETGGDLGWARRGAYVAEFERWVWALPPDRLSPVVESPFGYHIIRVDRVAAGEVKARHILIRPVLDSADVERARLAGDTVATLWRSGTPFDSLSKRYHDFASREETSLLTPFPRDSLPESYRNAFRGHAPNDIVTFEIPDPQRGVPKVVVAQLLTVDAGGERTLDEMREIVRSRLAQEGGVRRYLDSLRKRSYVSIRLGDTPVTSTSQ